MIYSYRIVHVDGSVNEGEVAATNMIAALGAVKMFRDLTVATEVSIEAQTDDNDPAEFLTEE